ncbi:MAG: NAD(P)/FAD-dependent oxidoreductase [Nitrospinae bacterium]|nr:NAD(P)/FAD-dependent oxidoreductase [Nitrospinota bacterium]
MGSPINFQVVIIGAGASGLMCALAAGRRGRRTLLLDHADRAGKKILVSGGGRCNFTNQSVEPRNYLSNNPHFYKSALGLFKPCDFIYLLKKHGVAYQERTLGQLFCKGSSREIVDLLLKECRMAGVTIQTKRTVEKIEKAGHFKVITNMETYEAESLVIATGGLSMPEAGATGFGHSVAKRFGLKVLPCRPGLVPLTLSKRDMKRLEGLAGVSVYAEVSCGKQSFREAVLFTHKGLSGPAILQISNYWLPGDEIIINLLPGIGLAEKIRGWRRERPKSRLSNLIGGLLAKSLARQLLGPSRDNKPVNQYNEKEIKEAAEIFHQWRVLPSGTEGYGKAEVTIGGVDTDGISSKTFEARRVKGLYFIGEVLDVAGWLGGYNLHWAWASGYRAGQFV